MTVYQGSISIGIKSSVGSAPIGYAVDGSGTTYQVDNSGNLYSAGISFSSTIQANTIYSSGVSISIRTGFVPYGILIQLNAIAQNYAPEDWLQLSVNEDGDWTATLRNYKWTDLGQGGIFKGFQIVSGSGIAVLNEDPQYHYPSVGVDIMSPFTRWSLPPTSWQVYIPLGTDFNSKVYSPNYFRSSNLISSVMTATQNLVVSESKYLTQRTSDFRKWDKISPEFLDQLITTLGCYLNISKLGDETKRRLVVEWKEFVQYAGTENFIDFLGYLYNTRFTIKALWTNNYRNFVPYTTNLDSSYYPTNHVAVIYDSSTFNLQQEETYDLLIETFYELASVPIVLQYFLAESKNTVPLYLIMADQTTKNTFSWSMPPKYEIPLYITMVMHHEKSHQSRSVIVLI